MRTQHQMKLKAAGTNYPVRTRISAFVTHETAAAIDIAAMVHGVSSSRYIAGILIKHVEEAKT
jgi:hypothetical protein